MMVTLITFLSCCFSSCLCKRLSVSQLSTFFFFSSHVTASKKFRLPGHLEALGGFPYRWGEGRGQVLPRERVPLLPAVAAPFALRPEERGLALLVRLGGFGRLAARRRLRLRHRADGARRTPTDAHQTGFIYSLWKTVLLSLTAAFVICRSRALARIVEDADALCGAYELDVDACIQRHQVVNPIFWQSLTMVVVVVASTARCVEDRCDAALPHRRRDGEDRLPMILTLLYYPHPRPLGGLLAARHAAPPARPPRRPARPALLARRPPPREALRAADAPLQRPRPALAELGLRDDDEINRFANRVLRLQEFHRSLNGHFGAALTLVIAYCMSTCIVAAFSLSFFSILLWKDRVVNVFYLMHSFFPLVVLTNSPLVLEEQVSPFWRSR
ncbi:hypothetical protein C7M84_020897 [Penaeus vannamei]|uniref:G-protein coupled receptors family 1 profile domain-containing protein n=1 Tax=Penaeus vannamei TaxID=6689 RepID=A0A423SAT7_PENVA|nr:hypothetical protein C7M84_020897 [Penaeus vannamei]